MSHYIVGLTGGIGSGKTTVANQFAKLGIVLVDADIIARDIVKPGSDCLKQITSKFGQEILLADHHLDRAKLRAAIFSNPEDKQWLDDLMHPLIRAETLLQLKQAQSDYCILVAPLLFENKLEKYVNTTLVIDVSEQTQTDRTVSRDNVSAQQVSRIIAAQMKRAERLAKADDMLNNEQSWPMVEQQILALHHKYLNNADSENKCKNNT